MPPPEPAIPRSKNDSQPVAVSSRPRPQRPVHEKPSRDNAPSSLPVWLILAILGGVVYGAWRFLWKGSAPTTHADAGLPGVRALNAEADVVVEGDAGSDATSPPPVAARNCPEDMRLIEQGSARFMMGDNTGNGSPDEQPPHEVSLSTYCIHQTETTVRQYAACVRDGACATPTTSLRQFQWPETSNYYSGSCTWRQRSTRETAPMNCVDWLESSNFCQWLSRSWGSPCRLPTEAEWEFAAVGPDFHCAYPWGCSPPTPRHLNACDRQCARACERACERSGTNNCPADTIYFCPDLGGASIPWDDGSGGPALVGQYPDGKSHFELLDMAGNVAEWVGDVYAPYDPAPATRDPARTDGGAPSSHRVVRGGSWRGNNLTFFRAARRQHKPPESRDSDLGFRCVCAPRADSAPALPLPPPPLSS